MIVNPGIRRFLGSAIQRLFNSASFYAPLTHSLVPERGTGSPTFIRATTSTWQNNDGYLVTGLAGEIGFPGARRVRNLLGNTENLLGAGWTAVGAAPVQNVVDPDGGTTGWSKALGGIGEEIRCLTTYNPAGRSGLGSVYLKGTGTVSIRLSNNVDQQFVTQFTLASDWTRVSTSVNAANSTAGAWLMGIVKQAGDTATSVSIWHPQLEDVTAQTTQTAGEYVSVGALDYRSELNRLYLSLPGSAGNQASTPDSAASSPVGDAAFVFYGAHTDWTPAAVKSMVGKFSGGGQSAYWFYLTVGGAPVLSWTADGTTTISKTATANPVVADGNVLYVAATLDVDNGAGGYDVKFWTSSNGTTWTQLGATVTTAGSTSIFNGSGALFLGDSGGGSFQLDGKIRSAQIYNGIPTMLGGSGSATPVVDFNPHRDATTPTGTITSSTTGEVWTINGASSVIRSDYYHGSFVDGVKCFPTDLAGNPLTTMLGYQAEGARTNLVWPSEDLTHVRYVSGGGGIAVVADQAVAPDGTTTADQLTASGANGTLIQDLGVIASAAQTFSLYLKRKTGTGNIDITLDGGATWTTQTITTTEWTRCPITQTVANPDVGIRIVTSGDAIYAWGLQCE